jgi:hypothetical protein
VSRLVLRLIRLLCIAAFFLSGAAPRAAAERIHLPLVSSPRGVLLAAAYTDPAITGEGDEAILLWNTGPAPVKLAGWSLSAGTRTAAFPAVDAPVLLPGARAWCTADAALFRVSFGAEPACEWAGSDPAVPDLDARLRLANNGGAILLRDPTGQVVDTLLYGAATGPVPGWIGAAAQLYTRGAVAASGQLFVRKFDPTTGLPVDQDRAADWAGDLADLDWGRRVRLPGWEGWDAAGGLRASQVTANATITVAVAPEGLYTPLAAVLAAAQTSLDLSLYSLEHPELTALIAAAAQRGVAVRLLLEGGPSGGITDLQRWCVRQIAAAGGDVRYLAPGPTAPAGLAPRYRFTHAKYGQVDGRLALVGTENFGWDAMPLPAAPRGLPVGGRRGVYLFTDAAEVAAALADVFARDWSPDRFADLYPYTPGHSQYGDPPPGYAPPPAPVYFVDDAPFAAPVTATGPAAFIVQTAPEHSLRPDDGLLALVHRAGPGDQILWVQLYEHTYWGESVSNPIADPNPRLVALLAAARRGAQVRVLLDRLFDDPHDPRGNQATVDYLIGRAAAEGLDLQARLGNPTGGGIHAKLALLRVAGATWSAVGSLNGGEISHKLNREVVLLVDAPAIHARLAQVFAWDWAVSAP